MLSQYPERMPTGYLWERTESRKDPTRVGKAINPFCPGDFLVTNLGEEGRRIGAGLTHSFNLGAGECSLVASHGG